MQFGATHTYASVTDALADLDQSTWNRGFNKVILTVGLGTSEILGEAFNLAGKRGRVVVTNTHSVSETSIAVPALMLTFFEKQLVGTVFGSGNVRRDVPRLLEMYTQGQLEVDSMITRTYTLDEINEGYQDIRDGKNIRGVLIYD